MAAAVDALDPRDGHQPGDLLAVPRLALLVTVVDLGGQPAGAVGATVLGPGIVQFVGGVRVVEVLVGHGPGCRDRSSRRTPRC